MWWGRWDLFLRERTIGYISSFLRGHFPFFLFWELSRSVRGAWQEMKNMSQEEKPFKCPFCGSPKNYNEKKEKIPCPECGSLRTWKSGFVAWPLYDTRTQRYYCANCGKKFCLK
jgi:DNA-directed RNA polymerase subunit RPC12/RpoP